MYVRSEYGTGVRIRTYFNRAGPEDPAAEYDPKGRVGLRVFSWIIAYK